MTDTTKLMCDRLRGMNLKTSDEAADLIEQQAATLGALDSLCEQRFNEIAALNARIAELESRLGAQAGDSVAYVYEHASHPGDYTRFVSFEQTGHSKDFVCRPLYAGPSRDLIVAARWLADLASGFNVSGVYFTEDRENREALAAVEDALATSEPKKTGE